MRMLVRCGEAAAVQSWPSAHDAHSIAGGVPLAAAQRHLHTAFSLLFSGGRCLTCLHIFVAALLCSRDCMSHAAQLRLGKQIVRKLSKVAMRARIV